MPSVFINYRRGDTAGDARALFNMLAGTLGPDAVFMDVDAIAVGRDFRQAIRDRLAACDLMLAFIGQDWLSAADDSGARRLDDPEDFVRFEIETAMKRGVRVTPLLVQGARMPAAPQLPEALRDFAYLNAFEIRHNRWDSDARDLVKQLGLEAAKGDAAAVGKAAPAARNRGLVAVLVGVVLVAVVSVGSLLYFRAAPASSNVTPSTTADATKSQPKAAEPVGKPEEAKPLPPNPKPADTKPGTRERTAEVVPPRSAPKPATEPAASKPALDPAHFVNDGIASNGGRAVLIVDQALGTDSVLTSRVAEGLSASDSLFKPAFVNEGLFSQAQRGDLDVLKPLRLDHMQLVVFGTKSVKTTHEEVAGTTVVKATVTLNVRLVRPASGFSTNLVPVSASGSGFDEDRAIESASSNIIKAVVQQIGSQ